MRSKGGQREVVEDQWASLGAKGFCQISRNAVLRSSKLNTFQKEKKRGT